MLEKGIDRKENFQRCEARDFLRIDSELERRHVSSGALGDRVSRR